MILTPSPGPVIVGRTQETKQQQCKRARPAQSSAERSRLLLAELSLTILYSQLWPRTCSKWKRRQILALSDFYKAFKPVKLCPTQESQNLLFPRPETLQNLSIVRKPSFKPPAAARNGETKLRELGSAGSGAEGLWGLKWKWQHSNKDLGEKY